MNVAIRVDSSTQIGIGHLTRCLTLANKLKLEGFKITFICRELTGNLNQLVIDADYNIIKLKPLSIDPPINDLNNYAEWLGVSEIEDANETLEYIKSFKINLLIIDNYSIGVNWEGILRPYVDKIMVIDDIANRSHDCDVLLDQNWFKDKESRYDGLVPKDCVKLLGPEYALLRDEFAKAKEKLFKLKKNKLKRVFIFFGGSDPHNLIGKTINALSVPVFSDLKLDIIISKNNPHKKKLLNQIKNRGNIKLYIQVENLANIMLNADFAIASGGVNTWERMCLNIFSMVIITADNQRPTIEELKKHNHIFLLGKSTKISEDAISRNVKKFILDRQSFNVNQLHVDGLGASRVSSFLKNITL